MNIRIFNVKILRLDKNYLWFFEDGEVWIENSYITHVGTSNDLNKNEIKWDKEINGQHNLLMPGFKNTHTHSAMTFLRSYADNVNLKDWLNKYIFPMEKNLTPELVYWSTILAIMEYLSSGITSNFDMYFYPDIIAKAAIDTGFRTVQTAAFNNFSSSINELENIYYAINNMSDLTSFIVGFHAEYTTSLSLMEEISKLAYKLHSPVWFHNAETKQEVDECKKRWGLTPTSLAEKLGMYEYGGGGYHCIWLEDSDFDIFQRRKLTAVINTASNLKLNSGIPPIKEFVDKGIFVAIGTDGAASNNSLDMFKEMFLVASLSKMRANNPACISAEQVLYMATIAGAEAMGLKDCNNIEIGKKADLVLIDIHQPNMQPSHNLIGNIVYSGSKQNIKFTMVNGKILYENNKFYIGIDPREVYERIDSILMKIMK